MHLTDIFISDALLYYKVALELYILNECVIISRSNFSSFPPNVLSYFLNTSYSHQFALWPFFCDKRAVLAMHFFNFTVFFRRYLQQGYVVVTTYDISVVVSMHLLKDSLLQYNTNCSHHTILSMVLPLFNTLYQRYCV